MYSTFARNGELWQLSATEVLPLLLNDQIDVETYARSLLSRISERDSAIKAWAYLNSDLIITRARQLDALPKAQRGPLHGLAVGVKDVLLTKDMPTQYNSPVFYGESPSSVDAACVRALRAAGALIFGKTTTTEFASTIQGNIHQNFTRNAHAPDRTPGGSSSGSGAAVADFQVPLALGTQTGGSVIRPASFNGIWGMKGTWGSVSNEGMNQNSPTCDTLGVFARSADDLELVYRVLRLEEDSSGTKSRHGLRGARIGFCRTHVWDKMAGSGLKSAWKTAMTLLEHQGARVEELTLPPEFAQVSAWHADILGGEGRSSFLGTYLTAKEKLSQSLRDKIENGPNVSRKALLEGYDGCARLRPQWDSIASEYDAVLAPSVPDEAPSGLGHTGEQAFALIWTTLHAPAVNVPGLSGENGLPIGLTVVGARYTDMKTLNIARKIGAVFESQTS